MVKLNLSFLGARPDIERPPPLSQILQEESTVTMSYAKRDEDADMPGFKLDRTSVFQDG